MHADREERWSPRGMLGRERAAWDEVGKDFAKIAHEYTPERAISDHPSLGEAIRLLGDIRGRSILDCGCGAGYLSAYLAFRGAFVSGFDISEGMLRIASQTVRGNGTTGGVHLALANFGRLPFRDASFDLAIGAWILHHTESLDEAIRELKRVLKPKGKALFAETWGENPFLVLARKHLAGRFGIARCGTPTEHPLLESDVIKMREIFPEVNLYFPDFVFFKLAARSIFRWKPSMALITDALVRLDAFIGRRLPALRPYGYYCVVELNKEAHEHPVPQRHRF